METTNFEADEMEMLACCGSRQFAREMVMASPFTSLQHAISAAREIWFNRVDVKGCLEAFEAHPPIGQSNVRRRPESDASSTAAGWSRGEQSTALATATTSIAEELSDLNVDYLHKFGFIFITCASGRSSVDILAELKIRLSNRPIMELEIAAQEQMKITEIRLAKLFSSKKEADAKGSRMNILGAHFVKNSDSSSVRVPGVPHRSRPPITTHVLDVSLGKPASGIEVLLEMWKGRDPRPPFNNKGGGSWQVVGSSVTDQDGRSGKLLDTVDCIDPGAYRISFNTVSYTPGGFFPYISIVFEIAEHQSMEHFHVPLLLSPFSFTTYRGS